VIHNQRGWGNDQDDYDIELMDGYIPLEPNASTADLFWAVDNVTIPDLPIEAHKDDLRWSAFAVMFTTYGVAIGGSVEVRLFWRKPKINNPHLVGLSGKERKKRRQKIRNRYRRIRA
jgi:hypothetical protein